VFQYAALKSNSKHALITRKQYAFSFDFVLPGHRATFAARCDGVSPLAATPLPMTFSGRKTATIAIRLRTPLILFGVL